MLSCGLSVKYTASAVLVISKTLRPRSFSVRVTKSLSARPRPLRPTSWYEQSSSEAISCANIFLRSSCRVLRIPSSVSGSNTWSATCLIKLSEPRRVRSILLHWHLLTSRGSPECNPCQRISLWNLSGSDPYFALSPFLAFNFNVFALCQRR